MHSRKSLLEARLTNGREHARNLYMAGRGLAAIITTDIVMVIGKFILATIIEDIAAEFAEIFQHNDFILINGAQLCARVFGPLDHYVADPKIYKIAKNWVRSDIYDRTLNDAEIHLMMRALSREYISADLRRYKLVIML